MKKKRRRLKKKSIIVLLFVILILFFLIKSFVNSFGTKDKFRKIGYNNIEIIEIKKLTKDEKNIIKNNKYNKDLIYILKNENYKKKKLSLYLKYSNKYKKIKYSKIIELVNNKDFNEKKAKDYFKILNNNSNIDGIIKYVNNYNRIDKSDDITINLVSKKYFIYDFLDRYLDYYKNNSNLDYEEIIRRVNSNLDLIFYEDSKPADIEKGMYTLVNKYFYLDENYIPNNLIIADKEYVRDSAKMVDVALNNFMKMADDAKKENLTIKITTGYRSYAFQATLYNNYVKYDGKEKADTYSARPGFSEHQLGYSCDITNINNVSFEEFYKTPEYEWLKDNAYKYGFIQRYPEGKEYITGFIFESWHYRYVGYDIAKYIYENNITYEEYYSFFLR